MKKVLLKDIVIPKGTVFTDANGVVDRVQGHYATFVGLTNNTCGEFVYAFGDDQEEISEWFADFEDEEE